MASGAGTRTASRRACVCKGVSTAVNLREWASPSLPAQTWGHLGEWVGELHHVFPAVGPCQRGFCEERKPQAGSEQDAHREAGRGGGGAGCPSCPRHPASPLLAGTLVSRTGR